MAEAVRKIRLQYELAAMLNAQMMKVASVYPQKLLSKSQIPQPICLGSTGQRSTQL